MKPPLFSLILGSCCLSALLFFYPPYLKGDTIIESVIIDKTDSFLANPDIHEIGTPIQLNENKWSGINLRIQTVSDLDFNKVIEIRLPSRNAMFSNPDERDLELKAFTQRAATVMDSITREKAGKPKSSIYRSVITDLNWLASQKAVKKIAIIYSDLSENSFFSIYKPKDRSLLKAHPEQVKNRFEQAAKPLDLTGSEIYFIFRPKSERENDTFSLMVQVFKSILESAGATVYIGANVVEK